MVYINAYVRQHFSPLNVLSDRAVQSNYRLPRVEIQRLVTLVSPHIQRATRCNFALSPEVQLLLLTFDLHHLLLEGSLSLQLALYPQQHRQFLLMRRTSVSLQVQVVMGGRPVKPFRMRTPGPAGWRAGTGLDCGGSSSPGEVYVAALLPDGSSSSSSSSSSSPSVFSESPSSPSRSMTPLMPSEAVFTIMERTFSSSGRE